MSHTYKDLALRLLSGGLEPFPVEIGKKTPPKGVLWKTTEINKDQVSSWAANGLGKSGIGLRCGHIKGIDVDVRNIEASKKIAAWMDENLNNGQPLPRRFGAAPKFLTPCTCDGIPYKIKSTAYVDGNGAKCQIEVLASGQYFVATGRHEDTGREYQWLNMEPKDLSYLTLPDIAEYDILMLIDYFEELAQEEGWQVWQKETKARLSNESTEDDPFRGMRGNYDRPTFEQLTETVKKIPASVADDYDEWIRVGLAIHRETAGSMDGYELFDSWSSLSEEKYKGHEDTKYRWDSFGKSQEEGRNEAQTVTFGTLCALAETDEHPPAVNLATDNIQVMTAGEAREAQTSNCLHICDDICFPGGLIKEGMEALFADGRPSVKQYAFPVVVATLANAIAGKITCMDVWPNLYNIKIGQTSTGKTVTDKAIRKALKKVGVTDFICATEIASGPGLLTALQKVPQSMGIFDEVSSLFKRYSKADPVADGKRNALLDIYSNSGMEIIKTYGNSKNNIAIQSPCFTLTGNATLEVFNDITEEDFASGLMPRFDFFCYDGKGQYRDITGESDSGKMTAFAHKIKALHEGNTGGFAEGQYDVSRGPIEIGVTAECRELLQQYSNDIVDQVNNPALRKDTRGIVARQYDLAIKYAMIHAASQRRLSQLTTPLECSNLEYGIRVAEMLARWKIKTLRGNITTGDFHRDCELFKEAIIAALSAGRRPTFKILCNRRTALKNWQPRDSKEVIAVLAKRGEIIVDESRKTTAYFLPQKE